MPRGFAQPLFLRKHPKSSDIFTNCNEPIDIEIELNEISRSLEEHRIILKEITSFERFHSKMEFHNVHATCVEKDEERCLVVA